ncbi:MAG: ion channel [PVC group bacterium]
MFSKSAKTRSYLAILIALLSIMVVMPCIDVHNDLINNLVLSVFLLLFLLAAIKVTITEGVAPRKPLYKWGIRATIIIAFIADLGQSVLYTVLGNKEELYLWSAGLFHLSGEAFWLHLLSFIAVIGYTLLILSLIFMIIRDLFSGSRVTVNKIFGAIVAYLLLGLLWAFLYCLFEFLEPGTIIRDGGARIASFAEAQYFSFTTLCTVGYGDIVPHSDLAMVFANLESVAGQLYLAILVARLIGLYTSHRSKDQPEGEHPAKQESGRGQRNAGIID